MYTDDTTFLTTSKAILFFWILIRKLKKRVTCYVVKTVCRHNDVIKWKHFPRYWHFVRGIHRSPVNSPHKRPVALSFDVSLICAWTNGWVNHRDASDLGRHCVNFGVTFIVNLRNGREQCECLFQVSQSDWSNCLKTTSYLTPWFKTSLLNR